MLKQGRAKAEKNNIKQTDDNKKITISALLGGNFAYHAIRQQQQLNISALLGGGTEKSLRVEELLDMSNRASNELTCVEQ